MTRLELIALINAGTSALRKTPGERDPRFKNDSDDEINDGVFAGVREYFSSPSSPNYDVELAEALLGYGNAWNEEEVNKPN